MEFLLDWLKLFSCCVKIFLLHSNYFCYVENIFVTLNLNILGRAGGEGAADRAGVGVAEHAGRPHSPGGQGEL